MEIASEALGYWYLRLNGFLSITNFLVHPEVREPSTTEVDVLAARFPYRSENLSMPMLDDPKVLPVPDRVVVAIVEIKTSECALNGPWTYPTSTNMLKVIRAVGAFPAERSEDVAAGLLRKGVFSDETTYMTLMCLGSVASDAIGQQFPMVPQITWTEALLFIYSRLRGYAFEKAQHSQWDRNGQALWTQARDSSTSEHFVGRIQIVPPTIPRNGGA